MTSNELCEIWKIDELWEMMNHAMLTCNWLYDNDKVMDNGWMGDLYAHDILIN
jgi:hypothetical protein